MKKPEFGRMTTEQTVEVVKEGLDNLTVDEAAEAIAEWVKDCDNVVLTDTLLEKL